MHAVKSHRSGSSAGARIPFLLLLSLGLPAGASAADAAGIVTGSPSIGTELLAGLSAAVGLVAGMLLGIGWVAWRSRRAARERERAAETRLAALRDWRAATGWAPVASDRDACGTDDAPD